MKKTLVQLHWQFKDGKTDCRAQREISSYAEMREWMDEAWRDFPPPEGAHFLAVLEESPLFVFMEMA